jgi:hypothetical protein
MVILDVAAVDIASEVVALALRLIIMPCYGVFLACIAWRRRDRVGVLLLASLVTLWALSAVASRRIVHRQVRAAMAEGDEICAALEGYHDTNGALPSDLTWWLSKWNVAAQRGLLSPVEYRIEPLGHDDYRLSFAGAFMIVHYRCRTSGWECD